jgi:hypothetical protein
LPFLIQEAVLRTGMTNWRGTRSPIVNTDVVIRVCDDCR